MTLATANSFNFTAPVADTRDADKQRNAQSVTQLTRLQHINNLIDWKSHRAEVQLLPSSCIDSYLDLVVRGNPIPLLPSDKNAIQHPVNAQVTFLGTPHTLEQLHLRCRNLALETAPDAKATPNKLYLAAGFVVYQSNGETKRAPILLIPVTLERLRGRSSDYGLKYLSGKPLQVNPQIADMCATHVEQLIEPFNTATDLREYLRGLKSKVHKDFACKITANTGIISLQPDIINELSREELINIELERTKPGAGFKPLPATPENFDPQLAIRILRHIEPENLHTALHNFAGQPKQKYAPVADVDPELSEDTLEKYHNCAGWLVDVGLGHWTLENIAALPDRVLAMESSINQLLESYEFKNNFRDEYRTVGMLYRLNKAKDLILNAPPEMQHHSISLHADSQTRVLLQQAKIQASSLEHEMKNIRQTFQQSAVPSSSTLSRLIGVISRRDDESQLANPEYFRARRTLNEILGHNNGVLTDNDLEQLSKLAKTLQFSETFNSDPYYKRHFGSLFRGTETNWQRLDSVVAFNHALSLEFDSSLLVAQFSDRWVSFERDINSINTNIESAASSVHKLCSLIPMFIDKSTRLEHASRTAEKFRCRIDQWQRYLHKNFADSALTPIQLLSHLELGEYSYPTVTLSQHEFDERIYRHIVGQGLPADSVSATSKWLLNSIVDLQTDTATVRRFLDRESTLHSKLDY